MNNIRYCKRCNSVYKYVSGNNLCPSCLRKYDEIMDKIKKYLRENPSAGIMELSKEIEEKERDILYLLKIGRISLKTDAHTLQCEKCGIKIENGKFCNRCTDMLRKQFSGAAQDVKGLRSRYEREDTSENSSNSKMYTIYRHKNSDES